VVLNTDTMSWERGKFSGLAPLSRYGHCSTSIGPHLLIFGGWEFNRASNDVIVLRDVTIGKKKNNSQSD
jgi:hypothetical protein